jgi:hypothetical protein
VALRFTQTKTVIFSATRFHGTRNGLPADFQVRG